MHNVLGKNKMNKRLDKWSKKELINEFKKLKPEKEKNYCMACNDCVSCHDCNYCNYCNNCDNCKRLTNGILCRRLRFEYGSENAYNKDKFWVLNKEVSKKEFEKIKEIMK